MTGLIKDLNTNAAYGHSKKVGLGRKPLGARAKKNISKASDNGTRKVLSDISNLNQNLNRTATKKDNRKLTQVSDEQFDEKDISEEGFLHDHRKCIKANNRDIDVDHFLETLGLPNGFPKELPSPMSPERPPRSPSSLFLEMMEVPIQNPSALVYSPPKSPDDYLLLECSPDRCDWPDRRDCSFKLIDSP